MMARATVQLPTKVLDELAGKGTNLDAYAEDALKAGAAVVEPVVAANLAAAIVGPSSGQLAASLGTSPVGQTRSGNHNIKIGFSENRSDGKRNAMIAALLEYGTSTRPARPFLAKARRSTRKAALEAMKQTLATRLGKGGG